jgi:hypothetical protein
MQIQSNPYLNLNEVIADDLRSFEDLTEQNPPTRFGALHSPQANLATV